MRLKNLRVAFLHNGYESLGLEYLSAALKAEGAAVELFIDPCLFRESGFWDSQAMALMFSQEGRVLEELLAWKPDLVCFSVFTDNYRWALAWAGRIKARADIPVVFGGIHPTSAPETVIAEPAVDYVCVGDGERALPELAAALRAGLKIGIPGIWHREGGGISSSPPAPPQPLDGLLPPDKELFYGKYPFFGRSYLAAASRGCPYACGYCCNGVYKKLHGGGYYRKRGPGAVVAELEKAKERWKPEAVHFTDEVFNADKAWLEEFLPLYRERVGLPFSCYAFPDLLDEAAALALKKAGCFKVQLGVQRFDETKRAALLDRRSSNAAIAKALAALKKAGIYSVCDNILGLPDETPEELDALLRFYHENAPDANEVFFLKYYPGTPLFEKALAEGLLTQEEKAGILAGLGHSGIIKGKGAAAERYLAPLLLFPLLPRGGRAFLLKGRRYLLPAFGNIALRVMVRLIRRPRRDFYTEQFARRYLHFALKKFF